MRGGPPCSAAAAAAAAAAQKEFFLFRTLEEFHTHLLPRWSTSSWPLAPPHGPHRARSLARRRGREHCKFIWRRWQPLSGLRAPTRQWRLLLVALGEPSNGAEPQQWHAWVFATAVATAPPRPQQRCKTGISVDAVRAFPPGVAGSCATTVAHAAASPRRPIRRERQHIAEGFGYTERRHVRRTATVVLPAACV
jgi:hypothetical protein